MYENPSAEEPLDLEHVQGKMLEHLRQLARVSNINPRDISIAAQLIGAMDMCRLAGLSQSAIDDALFDAKME